MKRRRKTVKLENHHPSMLLYCHLTRTVINAYMVGGWDSVDEVMRKVLKRYFRTTQKVTIPIQRQKRRKR